MEIDQIKAIIAMMKENELSEFSMEQDGLKIRIKRGPEGFQQVVTMPAAPGLVAPSPTAAQVAAPAPTTAAATPTDLKHITSPMVGTFYRSPAPDAPVYIDVGATVDEETVVCIIEAMKVMNEIKAEMAGVVKEILVKNGQAVEYGETLFLIEKK
jgi:acetyl-CoA carboxylase biotin carboxyl carrier protein